ncbi:unnamed protein product [Musa acuminata var. zebrina]
MFFVSPGPVASARFADGSGERERLRAERVLGIFRVYFGDFLLPGGTSYIFSTSFSCIDFDSLMISGHRDKKSDDEEDMPDLVGVTS